MRRTAPIALAIFALLAATRVAAETVVSGLSQDRIQITSSYSGTDIVVFGAIENASDPRGRDVVVVIRGPKDDFTVRRKSRVAGIWVNSDRVIMRGMPAYYYLAASRSIDLIAPADTLDRYELGVDEIGFADSTAMTPAKRETYRQAVVRAKGRQGLYVERHDGVEFLGDSLFRVRVPVPATVPRGDYEADVYLFRDGAMIGTQASPLHIEQAGFERRLLDLAHDWPLAYGVSAVLMSLAIGWLSSMLFRQNR